ncbi:hypothetical protein [Cellulosimicrobium sp. CUA-896]|nr:hypothetical protein [Cellulosimicrobium sp. CUA-896]
MSFARDTAAGAAGPGPADAEQDVTDDDVDDVVGTDDEADGPGRPPG